MSRYDVLWLCKILFFVIKISRLKCVRCSKIKKSISQKFAKMCKVKKIKNIKDGKLDSQNNEYIYVNRSLSK